MVDTRSTTRALASISLLFILILSLCISPTIAQGPSLSSTVTSPPPTTPSPVVSLSTGVTTITTTVRGRPSVILSTFIQTSTLPPSSTSTSPSASANSTAPSATPEPIHLDTRVTPTFAVLGALLILTGLPSAFWGHKNRWTSFFLIGFYTLALICLVLIIRFGVITEIKPPSRTLQGLFLLSCCVAGFAGGGIAIFFWKGAKYFIGGWGGFAFALWVQCFHNGGLIKPIAPRWIFFIAMGVIGFVLCSIPKVHYVLLLFSTAIVGATAIVLGIDCFTTAGLKEFYMFNLGFQSLFPKFYPPPKSPQYPNPGTVTTPFPVSQNMQVELGIIAAITLMGIPVQFRIYVVLLQKLREITQEEEIRRAEAEMEAAKRFRAVDDDLEAWEGRHGKGALEASRSDSAAPLIDGETPFGTAKTDNRKNPSARFGNLGIGLGEGGASQRLGPLPALDLGTSMRTDIPTDFVSAHAEDKHPGSGSEKDGTGTDQNSEILLAEIQAVRRELTAMRSETGIDPVVKQNVTRERHKSFSGLTTYSFSSRSDPNVLEAGATQSRPNSTPLRDEDWDAYVRDRKLFVPPSGVTPAVASHTPSPSRSRHSSMHMDTIPEAVADALSKRKDKEKLFAEGGPGLYAAEAPEIQAAEDDQLKRRSTLERAPGASEEAKRRTAHARTKSADAAAIFQANAGQPRLQPSQSQPQQRPVSVLPPVSPNRPARSHSPARPVSPYTPEPRVFTFEELSNRHREKMREMQRPLSDQEHEQVRVDAAKSRWARANKNEREVMERKEVEARASLEAKRKEKEKRGSVANEFGERPTRSGREGGSRNRESQQLPSKSASAEKQAGAGAGGSSQRRSSAMKVQEWQKYQQRSMSSPEPADSDIPFPSEIKKQRRTSRVVPKQHPT